MSQQEVIAATAALKASMTATFNLMNVSIASLRVFATQAAASAAAAQQSAIDASNGGGVPSGVITPNALSITGATGASAAGNLGVVSNATPTGTVTASPPISGMTFSMVGNTLRAGGAYPGPGTYSSAITVATDKGNLTFNLTATATAIAPTLSINPTSATIAATADQATDELLTTVSGGVPSGATGTLPNGLVYEIRGQQVYLTGTANAAAAAAARAAVIATSNGNITLNWNLTVNPAVTEAQAYAARVAAVSTPLSAPTIAAIETWVAALKTAGAWAAIKDCGLMIGSDLAAAMVKIKYPAGAPSSLANIGMNNGHYQPVGGMGWYGGNENDNQSMDTVSTATQLGASGTNISMGFMRMDYRDEAKPWFSAAVAAGTAETPAYITDYNSGTPDKVAVTGNGPSLRVVSVTADSKALVVENGAVVQDYAGSNGGTVTALDASAHFTMFKARRFGVDFFGTLRSGFYFVGTALTKAQAVALSRATRTLYKTLGRLNVKATCAYVGDSITAGFFVGNPNNRWSTISAVARDREEINFGVPSSSIRVINSDAQPLINRYLDIIAEDPGEFSVMMLSNDIFTDGTTNGDPTIIADCKAKATTIATAFKNTGKPVRWNGFPFTPNVSATKAAAYDAAIADVMRTLDIPYCSQYLRMQDTGTTATLLGGDGVHPTEAGMAFLATGDVEMGTGKTTRSVSLNFPSVAAGGTQDLNVTMYRAAPGASVAVVLPAGYPAGLTATAVATANDTVRIRVTNGTGAAIDPPAGTFLVTLNFTPPAASISSTASTRNGVVGATEDLLLGTVINGTATGVSGSAPPGMTFVRVGQELRMQGQYSAVAASANYTATVTTSNGTVTHVLTSAVTAAVPTLTPSPAAPVVAAVDTPVDVVLSTLTNATLTSVSGTLPAGLSFVKDGQNIKMTGTPTVASASANRTATIVTPGGNLTLTVPLTVNSAAGAGTVIADLKFEGTPGSTVVTNDAPAGADKLAFAMSGQAKLGTGQGVKFGTTCLFPNHNNFDGQNTVSVGDVNLPGDFEFSFWYTRTSVNNENTIGGQGGVFAVGDYNGSSYLDIEIDNGNMTVYNHASKPGGDNLGTIAGGVATYLPAGVPVYVTVGRVSGQVSVSFGGVRALGPVAYTPTITGKVTLLNLPDGNFGVMYAAMDSFLLTKGAAPHSTFPFTPPTA